MASTEETPANGKAKAKPATGEKPKCGIVMPIAAMDGYPAQHWIDVKEIISEVAEAADMDANIVSYTDEATVIHKTIIQNLYSNEIVVCDVSGKNPNVMFELGVRLTFDKPTVVIKDDSTNYVFDIGIIEHLTYPRDLHYQTIVGFKEKLRSKILATLDKFEKDAENASFLGHFGVQIVTGLHTQEITPEKFIIESISELTREIRVLKKEVARVPTGSNQNQRNTGGQKLIYFTSEEPDEEKWTNLHDVVENIFSDLESSSWPERGKGAWAIELRFSAAKTLSEARIVEGMLRKSGVDVQLLDIGLS